MGFFPVQVKQAQGVITSHFLTCAINETRGRESGEIRKMLEFGIIGRVWFGLALYCVYVKNHYTAYSGASSRDVARCVRRRRKGNMIRCMRMRLV